jgi:hypothetical protein
LAASGARRYLAAAVYALGLAFTAIAALGSQHGGRSMNEATATALTGERSRLESAYRRADTALGKLPATRPVAVVQAELDGVLKDPRLNDCRGWLQNSRLRATCIERVEPLRAELANANERQRLTGELASTSEALAGLTIGKPANADADSLGRYLEALGVTVTRERLADLLNLLTVASVELAGGIALALGQYRQTSAATETAPRAPPPINPAPKKRKGGRRKVEGDHVVASFIAAHIAKHGRAPSGRELIDRFPTIPRSTLYWHRANVAHATPRPVKLAVACNG